MFKRSQRTVSEGSKHWYQDKYQHVLTQRNILALVALVALVAATLAVLVVMRLAPLKSVEPYLLAIDEKTGITQKVTPISRADYAAAPAVDRYFTANYLRMREGYGIATLRYNHNVVRLMSTPEVFRRYRFETNPKNEAGYVSRLGASGQREVRIRSMAYIQNTAGAPGTKIMQARILTTESAPNIPDTTSRWVVTLTFEYADLSLNAEEQLLNPLGYTVTSYQITPEVE